MFFYHWREESQHAILDELEWVREDAQLDAAEREQGVSDLIDLVGAVDGILQAQAAADAGYFVRICGGTFSADEQAQFEALVLKAYRWQYIASGVQHTRFPEVLFGLVTDAQAQRIGAALEPIMRVFAARRSGRSRGRTGPVGSVQSSLGRQAESDADRALGLSVGFFRKHL